MGMPKRTKGTKDSYGKRAVNRHSVQSKNSARSQEKVIETRVRRDGKRATKEVEQLDLDLPLCTRKSLYDLDTDRAFAEFWGDEFFYHDGDSSAERKDEMYHAFVAGVEAARRFLNPEDE